jgi:aromatic ring-opening dioxygenase catalytic subunit (LigB family)
LHLILAGPVCHKQCVEKIIQPLQFLSETRIELLYTEITAKKGAFCTAEKIVNRPRHGFQSLTSRDLSPITRQEYMPSSILCINHNIKAGTSMNTSPLPQSNDHSQEAGSMIYLTHGGGPLPLLGDPQHQELVDFLSWIPTTLITPSAIVVISAHWEEAIPTITSGKKPALFYDYYGFPEESYAIAYPAPGAPELAGKIHRLFLDRGFAAGLDERRGFDHGVFVPLRIMYPKADIPCIQISLLESLQPQDHIQMGRALAALRRENLLIIGSGSSFHNLRAFREPPLGISRQNNEAFEEWLKETMTDESLSENERERRLLHWDRALAARYCHPREEHLLPLHVCYGIAARPAAGTYTMELMGKTVSAYIW